MLRFLPSLAEPGFFQLRLSVSTVSRFALVLLGLGTIPRVLAETNAEQIARAIRIDQLDFRSATIEEGMKYLETKAQEQLAEGQTLKLSSQPSIRLTSMRL